MTSEQVFQSVDFLVRAYPEIDIASRDGDPHTSDEEKRWKFAKRNLSTVLTACCPCSACSGTGIDPNKPFNPATMLSDPNTCQVCEGEGYEVEGGHGAVDAMIRERLTVLGYVS